MTLKKQDKNRKTANQVYRFEIIFEIGVGRIGGSLRKIIIGEGIVVFEFSNVVIVIENVLNIIVVEVLHESFLVLLIFPRNKQKRGEEGYRNNNEKMREERKSERKEISECGVWYAQRREQGEGGTRELNL